MKVGWIGIGNMGFPMASNILAAGYDVKAFDVSPERLARLVSRGAAAADSVALVCEDAEVIFSSIPDDAVLKEIALGQDAVLSAAARGTTYVEMSTVSPGVSGEVAAAAKAAGIHYVRAPVSGSVTLAESAALTVIASGPAEAFQGVHGLLERLGSVVFHVGEGDEARYLKLALNNMVYATAVSMAESLALCRKGGLDWDQTLEVFAGSAVGSPLVQYKAGAMRDRDFSPAMGMTGSLKDMDLFIASAREAGVHLDTAPVVADILQEMLDTDEADKDFFAAVLRAERKAGLGEP